MIVVAICSYREGPLLRSAVRSALPLLEAVRPSWLAVFEGPVGDADTLARERARPPDAATEQALRDVERISRRLVKERSCLWRGGWESDAAKRTALLEWAKRLPSWRGSGRPLWLVWLDGDEVLLWGEYLPDLIARAEAETAAGGFPLRIVELDGSVAKALCRVIRADRVRRFSLGAYELELEDSGLTVALPNLPLCAAGGVPRPQYEGHQVGLEDMAELRPPVCGEPHILHRAVLRDPERGVRRLHEVEAEAFEVRAQDDAHSRRAPDCKAPPGFRCPTPETCLGEGCQH